MIIHFKNFSLYFLLYFSLLILCFEKVSLAEMKVLDRIYLIVNSQMITRSEAQDVANALKMRGKSEINSSDSLDKELLTNLIQEMLILDRAEALKINPVEKNIEARMERLIDEKPNLLEIYGEDDLKKQLSREFKKHHVINREVDAKIRIENQEIELYCKQELRNNRKVGLAQILLKGTVEEINSRVRSIRLNFESGISFDDLAKNYSEDSSTKVNGGKLGIFKPGDLLAEIEEVAFNLEPGKISQVVNTNLGSHLLYIYEEEFAKDVDCANIKPDQRKKYSDALYNQKRNILLNDYMNELLACADIELKEPGKSGLPNTAALPDVKTKELNCHARRVMILPKKKEKKKSNRQN